MTHHSDSLHGKRNLVLVDALVTNRSHMGCIRGLFAVCFTLISFAALPATADPCSDLVAKAWTPPGDAVSLHVDSASLILADPTGTGLPEYCVVTGHLDTEINFILNLPTAWNNKIEMQGNSGFAGTGDLQSLDLFSNLSLGYALIGTDMGHSAGDASDFVNHPDRVKNFSYRAVHLVALTAKEITHAYYGTRAAHSYFHGCSRGGIEGIKEATKYPTDFDGIIAGAPLLPHNGGVWGWNAKAVYPNGPSSFRLPYQKLPLLTQYVLQKCDALDGVKDGIVSDPFGCNFSPTKDLPHCPGDVDNSNCFTSKQMAALEKIHEGPSSQGQQLGSHYYFSGVEGFNNGDAFGVGVNIYEFSIWVSGFPGVPALFPDFFDPGEPSLAYGLDENNMRGIVFNDPNFLLQNFDFNNESQVEAYLSHMAPQLASTSDLSQFQAAGGKIIMWEGLGDPLMNPAIIRDYYNDGVQASSLSNVKSFDRLFLAPGVSHCGGGPGFNGFSTLPVLENWIEKGQVPKFIMATSNDGSMTRPICAFPKVAQLISPNLDPTQASSFHCVNVQPRNGDID
jgi:Tannase and feruloyl esterase